MDATALDKIPLFADPTDEERAEVAACLHDVTVDAGAAITVQGDNAWQLFVIEAGEADVRRDGDARPPEAREPRARAREVPARRDGRPALGLLNEPRPSPLRRGDRAG